MEKLYLKQALAKDLPNEVVNLAGGEKLVQRIIASPSPGQQHNAIGGKRITIGGKVLRATDATGQPPEKKILVQNATSGCPQLVQQINGTAVRQIVLVGQRVLLQQIQQPIQQIRQTQNVQVHKIDTSTARLQRPLPLRIPIQRPLAQPASSQSLIKPIQAQPVPPVQTQSLTQQVSSGKLRIANLTSGQQVLIRHVDNQRMQIVAHVKPQPGGAEHLIPVGNAVQYCSLAPVQPQPVQRAAAVMAQRPTALSTCQMWIEIFKHLDSRTLLKLSLVCKTWNRLIFKYMSHRFELHLNPPARKFPRNGIGMVPDRNYKHLHLTSVAIDSSVMTIIERQAPHLESLKLKLESLDCTVMMQILTLCPRLNEFHVKGCHYLFSMDFDELLHQGRKTAPAVSSMDLADNKLAAFGREMRPCILKVAESATVPAPRLFPAIKSLGLDVTDLDKFKSAVLPNVAKLDVTTHQPDISTIEQMAAQLKILKIDIENDAAGESLANLQFPALEMLVLKKHEYAKNNVLKRILGGCGALKTAYLKLGMGNCEDVFPIVGGSLPHIERLQISSETVTSLEGIEKMTHLKELSLKGGYIIAKACYHTDKVPSLEKFELHDVMLSDRLGNVLKRFPNLRILSVTVRDNWHELVGFGSSVRNLKEFTYTTDRFIPQTMNVMKELTRIRLEKLIINAGIFAKSNFPLLREVIVISSLKSLVVHTKTDLPGYVTSKVAAANRSCLLVLNGRRVAPLAGVFSIGAKRVKQDTAGRSSAV